jgi:uncharacterized protein
MPFLLQNKAMNSPIPSPCISVCQMDAASGYCTGCYRTIEEIMVWGQASESIKQAVWQQLKQRHQALQFPQASRNTAFQEAA